MPIEMAHKLIKERELESGNLEKAEKILSDYIISHESPRAYGLLAQIQYWKGEIASKQDNISIYEKGIEFGKQGAALNENNIESNFWLGVCYGLLGDERGIMSSFFLLDPIETCFDKALKLDESYFYGAPLRSMGFFYHRIPGWPVSKGDNKKALAYLEKALIHGPDFYLNHLYIAYIYKSLGSKEKFRYHLEWIIKAEPTRKYAIENNRYKEEAKKILSR